MGWTDERMDDFARHTDQRFDAVDRRLDDLARHTDQRFDAVDRRLNDFAGHTVQRFDALDRRMDRLDDRFAALQRTLLLLSGGVMAALIGLIATQL